MRAPRVLGLALLATLTLSSAAQELQVVGSLPRQVCRTLGAPGENGATNSVCVDVPRPRLEQAGDLGSMVLTATYRERTFQDQEVQLRLGVHAVSGLAIESFLASAPVVATAAPALPTAMKFSALSHFSGLRWDRDNVLIDGDHFSFRAASETQYLARVAGLTQSSEQLDALALLGWRSRVQFNWQSGDPMRTAHWEFSARVDRRGGQVSEGVGIQVVRRF